jgi:hypothetical protein
MARIVIALRAYRAKYGSLPDGLNQLSPEFIDAVPRNPLDNQPFEYIPGDDKCFDLIARPTSIDRFRRRGTAEASIACCDEVSGNRPEPRNKPVLAPDNRIDGDVIGNETDE